jgi:site-specific DNA-cytosine methylase
MYRAVEFYSGIGAFAAGVAELPVEVVAAFDQNDAANRTYRLNFGHPPRCRNLDSILADAIPDADLWWMSPPCTPYSVRGLRRDDDDPRAASFLNLIGCLAVRRPRALLVENVAGFVGSRTHARLRSALETCAYEVAEVDLCPTLFGVPMRRPRRFVVARAVGSLPALVAPAPPPARRLADFLERSPDPALRVDATTVARYGRGFNVLEPDDPAATAICVTAGYRRSVMASGSYVRLADGGVRRLSPGEIVGLLGFPSGFRFPDEVPLSTRYRLAGNSVDVRAVRWLVETLVSGRAKRVARA